MKKCYLIVVLIFVMFSCSEDKYLRIIENKDELIRLSLHQDITNNIDRNYYQLRTYSSNYELSNHFIFKKEEVNNKTSYSLKYDSIQFSPDSIIGVDLSSDQYAMAVCRYYEDLSKTLKSYKIKSLIGEWHRGGYPGLKLMIYFDGGGVLLYYPKGMPEETAHLENYKYKKIAEGWYLSK